MICEKCGKEMKEYIIGSEQCWECTECGMKAVTTYIAPIYEDDTEYTIILDENNLVNKDTIILLMGITGLNMMQISQIIKNKCPYIFHKGNAVITKEIAERLKEKGILYHIEPHFKW